MMWNTMKNTKRAFVKRVLTIVIFGWAIFSAPAQNLIDDDLRNLFPPPSSHHHDFAKPLKESKNEVQFLMSALFYIYKEFISSQDSPSCIFTPSCSVYSIQAFQKKGLFAGWLYTFDRLMRCHGFADPHQYPLDPKTRRFYDPLP